MMAEEKLNSYRVLSISTKGSTMTVFRKFESAWKALDDELEHFLDTKKAPAQINITKE